MMDYRQKLARVGAIDARQPTAADEAVLTELAHHLMVRPYYASPDRVALTIDEISRKLHFRLASLHRMAKTTATYDDWLAV